MVTLVAFFGTLAVIGFCLVRWLWKATRENEFFFDDEWDTPRHYVEGSWMAKRRMDRAIAARRHLWERVERNEDISGGNGS